MVCEVQSRVGRVEVDGREWKWEASSRFVGERGEGLW